jgi:membrane protein implicated in regulation of membrane protease activity
LEEGVISHLNLRRWLGAAVFLLAIAVAVWVVPRLGVRSPLTVVLLPILAILTMKLVERRIGQWLRRWAEENSREARVLGRRGVHQRRRRGD